MSDPRGTDMRGAGSCPRIEKMIGGGYVGPSGEAILIEVLGKNLQVCINYSNFSAYKTSNLEVFKPVAPEHLAPWYIFGFRKLEQKVVHVSVGIWVVKFNIGGF